MTANNVGSQIGWNLENSYAQLPQSMFSRVGHTSPPAPKLIKLNEPLAASLGLNAEGMRTQEGVANLAGKRLPAGADPIAQAYAGHQFGHFNMLGDGRALLLGEQITPSGERFDIQLKGSGRTPYSRRGDGLAALGPMLREYIISEAMYSLGIPTTRSLAVLTTGESIYRETELPGAILTRVAASHIRVGTFQFAANSGKIEDLRALADYTMERHYPEIAAEDDNRYLAFLQAVIGRQAKLIAQWQLVGFIHGVMNTDNMAISGETIDYGPCAFMDTYNPETVFSSIDSRGRYAYRNQPPIASWNLARFAETLLPLLHENEEQAIQLAQDAISRFSDVYHRHWFAGMRGKLGLFTEEEGDVALFGDLLTLMEQHAADYTNTFVALTFHKLEGSTLFGVPEFVQWQERWQARLGRQQQNMDASQELMRGNNPAVIPRNHRVEEALEAAVQEDDYSVMEKLLAALANPFVHSPEQAEYAEVPAQSCEYQTFCGT
ncbi:protein adenylyltransferase SelO [Paenibacillus roseipurpureus]|uniref:Protein nucleotidyltransferase YdiU n=1 Tax=Paenibacillus roseopurpureus TaxID=2918901 RepID=A0AA96LQL9_9BACL|nr:YdiU family protein [Paenibacillus sp. MBLB1832]WNR45458.1 YdiU family protein [Paenibacillus sp. MBLB1832]